MLIWLRANDVRTKGENPKTTPPRKAAGLHVTHRRSRRNMVKAEKAGARVSATFIAATGPKRAVTGASSRARATTLVSSSRLSPPGWNSHVVNQSDWPCVRA